MHEQMDDYEVPIPTTRFQPAVGQVRRGAEYDDEGRDLVGTKPKFIDIKRHLGLGFSERSQKAMMLLKINGLIYGKSSCDWKIRELSVLSYQLSVEKSKPDSAKMSQS